MHTIQPFDNGAEQLLWNFDFSRFEDIIGIPLMEGTLRCKDFEKNFRNKKVAKNKPSQKSLCQSAYFTIANKICLHILVGFGQSFSLDNPCHIPVRDPGTSGAIGLKPKQLSCQRHAQGSPVLWELSFSHKTGECFLLWGWPSPHYMDAISGRVGHVITSIFTCNVHGFPSKQVKYYNDHNLWIKFVKSVHLCCYVMLPVCGKHREVCIQKFVGNLRRS